MIEASRDKPLAGGCQCGAVCYEIAGSPVALYVCHCRECRKQSASAFGISLIVRRIDFRFTKGSTRRWSRKTDSGRILHCAFCPDCGSRLVHEGGPERDVISVKGGSVDQPLDLSEAVHIWPTRKLPGVLIPEHAAQFPQEPDED